MQENGKGYQVITNDRMLHNDGHEVDAGMLSEQVS